MTNKSQFDDMVALSKRTLVELGADPSQITFAVADPAMNASYYNPLAKSISFAPYGPDNEHYRRYAAIHEAVHAAIAIGAVQPCEPDCNGGHGPTLNTITNSLAKKFFGYAIETDRPIYDPLLLLMGLRRPIPGQAYPSRILKEGKVLWETTSENW